jgi:hypothetical protein
LNQEALARALAERLDALLPKGFSVVMTDEDPPMRVPPQGERPLDVIGDGTESVDSILSEIQTRGPWLCFRRGGESRLWIGVGDEIEGYGDADPLVERAEAILSDAQDLVAEFTAEPWPASVETARGRTEPFPSPLAELRPGGLRLGYAYPESGEPVLELPAIPLSELGD